MCNESWGRSSFARCLIEVNSEADLVDVVTIGFHLFLGMVSPKKPSLLSMNGGCLDVIYVRFLVMFMTIAVKKVVSPPIVTTSNVVTPTVEKTNDGCKKKKRKDKSKSTNGGQFAGPSVKQNVRYEPATTSAPKKGVTNVGNTSQSASMLKTTEEDNEEDVLNVYDESANLILNTKAGGSSSFTTTAG
ncbi:hypothetical protein Tco_1287083 [Tanacetum coccineum]